MDCVRRNTLVVVALALLAVAHREARATCNVIPSATQEFVGNQGILDRPFASPGDWVTISPNPNCRPQPLANGVVSLFFKPPDGARHVVVIGGNGSEKPCSPNVPTIHADVEIAFLDPPIRFRFPDTHEAASSLPETFELTGPVAIAVTAAGADLPCALAVEPCAALAGSEGILACVDHIFTNDGLLCPQAPHDVFSSFTALPAPNDYLALSSDETRELRFTTDDAGNLLLPMNWEGVLVQPRDVPIPQLLQGDAVLRAFARLQQPLRITDAAFLGSYDASGVKIAPLFDPQLGRGSREKTILIGSADAERSVLRIARRSPTALTCVGGAAAGQRCATDAGCGSGASCGVRICREGRRQGTVCTADVDCAGGTCGEGLFDFRDRLLQDVGPIVLRSGTCLGGPHALQPCTADDACGNGNDGDGECARFSVRVDYPVPFDGLHQTRDANAFVVNEAIAGQDRNGDRTASSPVVLLFDRATGRTQGLDADFCAHLNDADGRAVARVRTPPFSFPALALGEDTLAFLEPEALETTRCDLDHDGDFLDTVLRVFRLRGNGVRAADLLESRAPRAVDAAPVIDGKSVVLSRDSSGHARVFFRVPETARGASPLVRVSEDADGRDADGLSDHPALSADGRFLAFTSEATNLGSGTHRVRHVFLHDRDADEDGILDEPEAAATATTLVAADANGACDRPVLSADGRFLAFQSTATNLVTGTACDGCAQVFVYDRDADRGGRPALARVSANGAGAVANGDASLPAISADGRFVAFQTSATNLDDRPIDVSAIFVRDRDADGNGIYDEPGDTTTRASGPRWAIEPAISADGSTIAYAAARAPELPGSDRTQVFAATRRADAAEPDDAEIVSVDTRGRLSNGALLSPVLSANGRYVAFAHGAYELSNLDTLGDPPANVFVRDRLRRTTERASGRVRVDVGRGIAMSGDGRYTAFSDGTKQALVVADRITGMTGYLPGEAAIDPTRNLSGPLLALSADGSSLAFASENRFRSDRNGKPDVFVRSLAFAAPSERLTARGRPGVGVLQVIEVSAGDIVKDVGDACPANLVAVDGDRAAYLRPESAGRATHCTVDATRAAGDSLNGDGDDADEVAQLWTPAGSVNLGVAATDVAIGSGFVAVVVREPDQGIELDDHDLSDGVLWAYRITDPDAGSWVKTTEHAKNIAVCGSVVAFRTSEVAQGKDLNGDEDQNDTVLQFLDLDAATPTVVNTGQPAEEFACSATLLAFRTPEDSWAPPKIMNGDEDTDDAVMQVYDLGRGDCRRPPAPASCLVDTGSAAIPCTAEVCDPRVPYRVGANSVTFITREADQEPSDAQTDLDGDEEGEKGWWSEDVVQHFDLRRPSPPTVVAGVRTVAGPASDASSTAAEVFPLGAVKMGFCATTHEPCASDEECVDRTCAVPTRRCIRDLGNTCDVTKAGPQCGAGGVCAPGEPSGTGRCARIGAPCATNADCASPDTCRDHAATLQSFVNPLVAPPGGGTVFTSAGRCVEPLADCHSSAECPGAACDADGSCHRTHGSCGIDADCPPHATCHRELTVVTASDDDGDEVLDPFDNCAAVFNPDQSDANHDGVGDACDVPSLCGNHHLDHGELCDDGNDRDGDGCSATCDLCDATPRSCRGLAPGTSRLTIARGGKNGGKLQWTLPNASVTSLEDFGDPLTTTTWALCAYDGSARHQPLLALSAPGGTDCTAGPCWHATDDPGYRYGGQPPGAGRVSRLTFAARPGGIGRMTVESKGSTGVPALPLTTTVTLQLVNDRSPVCWSTDFTTARTNTATAFRARHAFATPGAP